ncbi:hypothetical protein [Roseospirillum parvum]|uniref:Uncharacterized protein n=1 Tax=Roseospirillum parvum TaxID=83401 RepID=A0A1G7UEJ2_9PROT|nr:hypothetical protein [Roseospirillum parvum]SDG45190.1 hypothetical protein SAMN05421742_101285 [Roseospirillum parvum]
MSSHDNKYVQAAQQDFDALRQQWDEVRKNFPEPGRGGDIPDSRLAETAWNDFQEQSEKLRRAGETASAELRESYKVAREKVRKVVDAYRQG